MTPARRPGPNRRERGFALVIVLWAIVLLTLIATQLTAAGRAEVRLAGNLRGAAQAEAAADGAVHAAIMRLLGQPAGPWPPDPAPLTERVPGGRLVIKLGSDDGKLNLNGASADVLAALLRALGVDRSQAQRLALDMALWRFPSADTIARTAAYAQAGLNYGPPGAAYQSIAEVSLVLGMTPDIFARLRPHVTVYHEGDPDPRAADPVILALIGGPAAAVSQRGPPRPGRVATIDVDAVMDNGSRAARHAVVRLGAPSDRGGWSILAWE
jgi:general secretion pathway protein K